MIGKSRSAACLVSVVVALTVGLLLFGASGQASASAQCQAVGGVQGANLCTINLVLTAPCPFTLTLPAGEDLLITSTGGINCSDPLAPSNNSASNITINVAANMEMQAGSVILAENNVASGSGGNISITVGGSLKLDGGSPGAKISSSDNTGGGTTGNAGNITISVGTAGPPPTGDFTMEDGAKILADSANRSAGAIVITAAKSADVDGLVESFGGMTGVSNQPPGGGPITVDAGCDLTVSDTGKISSRGLDPGADRVHLQGGCAVNVFGLVESTGVGHAIPINPPNHCVAKKYPLTGNLVPSTACVEIWAGDSLTIDAKNHPGQINADTSGGPATTSYIDLFARGPITIVGDTLTPFAVHANGLAGTNDNGGFITVKSRDQFVLASGLALQADAINAGGQGGSIDVEAAELVNLDTASIFARGDFVATGGFGKGGTVEIRSFSGSLSWQNGVGDVEPTGTGVTTAANRGIVTFDICDTGTKNTTGTSFPFNGPAPTTPTTNSVGPCGGSPTIGVDLPACVCALAGNQSCISVTKFCSDASAFGQPINFNGVVSNCGSDALNNVTVVDDNGTPANTGDDVTVLGPITLGIGQSQPYSGSYTPGASGPSTDTVTATGTGAITGNTVQDQHSATCSVPAQSGQGCTPGFWKNHLSDWPPQFAPSELVNQVFNVGSCTSLGTNTLLQALSFPGGSTFCGKVQNLLRAGVSAVLSAASNFGYPLTVQQIISQVNAAIASGNATTVDNLQTTLNNFNNLPCPLN